jgi:sugar phosphate isomerase/epimerase
MSQGPAVRRYTFAPLTAMHHTPPQLLQLAAHAGIWGVGLRLLPTVPGALHYPLMRQPEQLHETLACMRDLGIVVFDLELIRIGAEFRAADLEPMPWSALPDVASAHRLLAAVQRPNVGVLVDALHFARSKSTLADVAALPREWIHYGQICDGTLPGPNTREGLIHDARCERLLPGEGDIDLRGLFAQLPVDVPVNIEVPNDRRAPAMGYEAWARAAVVATKAVLGDDGGR